MVDPGTAMLVGAGLSGAMSHFGASSANSASGGAMRENQLWQDYMSSTAHQRQVADLKKAGLNPMLSVNAGAQGGSPSMPTVQNTMEGFAASAREAAAFFGNLKKQNAEIGALKAAANASNTQAHKNVIDAKVNEKTIPQSDLMNRVYKLLTPSVNKIEESLKSGESFGSRLKKLDTKIYNSGNNKIRERLTNP